MIPIAIAAVGILLLAAGAVGIVVALRRLPVAAEDEAWLPEATPESVEQGVEAMRDSSDWLDDRVKRVIARHMAVGFASGSKLYQGRHRVGVAPGAVAQRAVAVLEPAGFEQITASVFDTAEMHDLARLVDEWRCLHCSADEHPECKGCTCPCGQQAVVR